MFSIIGAMAQLERDLIRERVTAGMRRAREKGKALGRPRKEIDLDKLIALREANYSLGKIATITGLPKSTVHSTLKTASATIS